MKPVGSCRELPVRSDQQAAVDQQHDQADPQQASDDPRVDRSCRALKVALKSLKNQPSVRIEQPGRADRGVAPCGLSRIAARAGLSVSELKAEITVETAIVTANWRKNWPVMPPMKRARHEHRTQHQGHGDHRPGDFVHRLARGLARRQALFQPALDVFHDHDRVVDHDADRQHQPEQRQVVQRKAQARP